MSIRPTDGRDTVEDSKAHVEANRTVDGLFKTKNETFIKDLSPETMLRQREVKRRGTFQLLSCRGRNKLVTV